MTARDGKTGLSPARPLIPAEYDLLGEHGIAFKEREPSVLICHVTGCENEAVGGEIGEGGDLLLCADHVDAGEATDG